MLLLVLCFLSSLVKAFIPHKSNHVKQNTQLYSETNQNNPSVWTVFGEIASRTGASNLGQGFPDWQPPPFVLDALRATITSPNHQYTRPAGHIPLANQLASSYSEHLDRPIDPLNEITITVGASQALYLSLFTILKPDDEVIMFEPYFDLYLKQLKLMPGVTPKFVSLGGDAATLADPWALDVEALKRYVLMMLLCIHQLYIVMHHNTVTYPPALIVFILFVIFFVYRAITPKTRILILNSPHNPTGKVQSTFTLAS